MDYDTLKTDILIIGSGVAGLTAAHNLIRTGRDILILTYGHGASPFITGFDAPVTPEDSIDLMIDDVIKSSRHQANPELVKTLCEGSKNALEYLKSIGFPFDMTNGQYNARQPVGASYPRVIGYQSISGEWIQNTLLSEMKQASNVNLLRMRALRLICDNYCVKGALCYDDESQTIKVVSARCVILACGGYCGLYGFSTNTSDIRGDGVAMAYYAGATLNDLEFIQFEPSVAVWPPQIRGKGMITTLLHEGAVLRNALGERFMMQYGPDAECVNKDVLGLCIEKEILEGRGTPHHGIWFDATKVPTERLEDAYSYFVSRYRGVGIELGKELVELAPAAHTSLGGVKIHTDASTDKCGLFACGEVTGNIHGANRIGGMAGLEVLVFGQIAADTANSYLETNLPHTRIDSDDISHALWTDGRKGQTSLSDAEIAHIQEKTQNLLDIAAGVIRSGESLQYAASFMKDSLSALCAQQLAQDPRALMRQVRLENDLTAAYLTVLSCAERKESVGCHYRMDGTETATAPYRLDIQREKHWPVIKRSRIY